MSSIAMNPVVDHKARGAFFTPPDVSRFIARWAIPTSRDDVLEPSCGDAAFLLPAAKRLADLGLDEAAVARRLTGVDVHEGSIAAARSRLAKAGYGAELQHGDFFDHAPVGAFDAVIGNPPYVRYQDFPGPGRANSQRAALAQGVRLNALASAWAAFTVHAAGFLKCDGRLGFVLPAELLSVNYAAPVRLFLMRRFARVQLILFERLIFPGVLEDVVLLLAEGRGPSQSFEVRQVRDAAALAEIDDGVSSRGFAPTQDEKWTPALLPSAALDTYRELTDGGSFTRLVDWGNAYLGSVTGNNRFFTLSRGQAEAHGLGEEDLLRISPPGARHLRGLTLTEAAWREQVQSERSCFMFSPRGETPSPAAQRYIAAGERLRVDQAYKCRVRSPWWRVPLVAQPDLLFTYMNHDRPRLVRNAVGVHALNSLYGITLKPDVRALGLVTLPIASLNTLTLLGSEIVGRAYGGGLLKHEPREADALPVPDMRLMAAARADLAAVAPQLASALRGNDLARAADLVDGILLERHLGLQPRQLLDLREAREALFQRRVSRGRSDDGKS